MHHFRHRRHEVILFHVMDRAEIDFPYNDVIAFHDLETNDRIQIDPAYVRDVYRKQLDEVPRRLPPRLPAEQIDYVLADTSVAYDFMCAGGGHSGRAPHDQSAASANTPVPDAAIPSIEYREARRRKRVQDLLLMLLRAALLILIALDWPGPRFRICVCSWAMHPRQASSSSTTRPASAPSIRSNRGSTLHWEPPRKSSAPQ